jgi:hypothetical protein
MVSADEAKNPAMDAETTVATALKAPAAVAPESATTSPAVAQESAEDDVREKPPKENLFVEKIIDDDTPKEVKPEAPAIKIETTKGRSNAPHIATPAPSKDMSEAGSEKEFKKKSGLRMYLASLTARNNAKKEYLASLEESNRAKKQLLTTKNVKRNKTKDKNESPDETPPVVEQKEEAVQSTVAPVEKKEQDDILNVSQPQSAAPTPSSPANKPDPVGSVVYKATTPAATEPSMTPSVDAAGNTEAFSEISENLFASMKQLAADQLEPTAAASGAAAPRTVDAASAKFQEDEATQRAASWNCCAW